MTTTKHFDDASSLEAINAMRLSSDLKVLSDVLKSAEPIASRIRVLSAVENSKISFEITREEITEKSEDGTYIEPKFGLRIMCTHKKGLSNTNLKFGLFIILYLDGHYSIKSVPLTGTPTLVHPIRTGSATEVGQHIDCWVKAVSNIIGVDLNPILQRTREELERASAASRSAPTLGK